MRVMLYEPSGRGGMKHYTEGLADSLTGLGVDISVLTSTAQAAPSNKHRVITRLRDPGRKVSRVSWPFDRALSGLYNSAVRAIEALSGYDICHLQQVTPLFDWATLRIIHIPLVLTVHDVHPHEPRWWKSQWFFHGVYTAVDHIIVHSLHNAKALVKHGHVDPAMVSVIPHGLDPIQGDLIPRVQARQQLGLPTDSPIALFFGSIRRDKGLDIALQAIAMARNWHLVVAGAANDLSLSTDLARQLGIGGRVYWRIGFIPDEEVTTYFTAADVVVLPYKPSFESQSGVLFQAYRHHIPVVVTEVGSLGETVREDGSGIVIPPDNPQALAKALDEALPLGSRVPWRSLELKYSWENVAWLTLSVYRKVVGDVPSADAGTGTWQRQHAKL